MGTEVAAFNPGKPPAHLRRGELSDVAKNLMGSGGGGKRVSIKGGVFRLLDNGKELAQVEERYLDVVIVNAAPKVGRTWYLKEYDSETNAAPDCWSADGDKPDPTSKDIQSERCADCAQNVKGSGKGDSRACRYQQRVALILADEITEESDVLQLTVPAMSLFGKAEGDKRPLQEYARWLAAQKVSPEALVTRLRFDTAAESPKLFFKAMRWLEDEEYAAVTTLSTSEDAIKAITMTVAQRDGTTAADEGVKGKPPAGAAKGKKAAPAEEDEDPPVKKTKAKPAAEIEEDEDPPAPPAKGKKAAPPADDEDDPPAAPAKGKKAAPPADEDEDPPARAPAKKKAAAPAEDEDEPPAKRKGASDAETSKVKKSAADLVNDWGDD